MNTLSLPPLPDKTRCAKCGKTESPNASHRRCSKCRAAPYCSVECQKSDWPSHKPLCPQYMMNKSLNYTGIFIGEKGPKVKKGDIKRTRGDILNDLFAWANSHNGDTLTVSAWNLLELNQDITRAQTHILALTLRRTESSNPRTYYDLVEVEVVPMTVLDSIYSNRSDLNMNSVSPRLMLKKDAERRKDDDCLGSVMVMSIELPKGENRPVRDALSEMIINIMQPLGLFDVHKNSIGRFPRLPKTFHIKCLENSLKGGAYSMKFQPYQPE